MQLNLIKNKTLLATWEFSEETWLSKSRLLKKFIKNIFKSENILYEEEKWNNNIIFKISSKPYQFYDLQKCFNEYFKSIGATILVD